MLSDQRLCFPFGIRLWFLQRCSVLSAPFLWSTFCSSAQEISFSAVSLHSISLFTGFGLFVFSLPVLSPLLASCTLSIRGRRQRVSSTAKDSRWFLGQGETPLVWVIPLGQPESDLLIHSQWMDGARLTSKHTHTAPGLVCQSLIWVSTQTEFYLPAFLIFG